MFYSEILPVSGQETNPIGSVMFTWTTAKHTHTDTTPYVIYKYDYHPHGVGFQCSDTHISHKTAIKFLQKAVVFKHLLVF